MHEGLCVEQREPKYVVCCPLVVQVVARGVVHRACHVRCVAPLLFQNGRQRCCLCEGGGSAERTAEGGEGGEGGGAHVPKHLHHTARAEEDIVQVEDVREGRLTGRRRVEQRTERLVAQVSEVSDASLGPRARVRSPQTTGHTERREQLEESQQLERGEVARVGLEHGDEHVVEARVAHCQRHLDHLAAPPGQHLCVLVQQRRDVVPVAAA
mmetsp:Transcript_7851/g.20230  ORF Transcript_7851/g.20230 Transcript_7851/m.20230 type:complete len:211 (-) Transcript_7851:202-834(-)